MVGGVSAFRGVEVSSSVMEKITEQFRKSYSQKNSLQSSNLVLLATRLYNVKVNFYFKFIHLCFLFFFVHVCFIHSLFLCFILGYFKCLSL